MQGNLELDIVSGSGVGHGTPVFDALSERSNHRRDYQSTVAGPPSCASVALKRRLVTHLLRSWHFGSRVTLGQTSLHLRLTCCYYTGLYYYIIKFCLNVFICATVFYYFTDVALRVLAISCALSYSIT